jgi:hypothetical protein
VSDGSIKLDPLGIEIAVADVYAAYWPILTGSPLSRCRSPAEAGSGPAITPDLPWLLGRPLKPGDGD